MARLDRWGFNTIGNWSDRRLYDLKEVPYVGTLSIKADGTACPYPAISPLADLRHVRSAVSRGGGPEPARVAGERRNDPWLIGYFVDNELPWGFMRQRPHAGMRWRLRRSRWAGSPAKQRFSSTSSRALRQRRKAECGLERAAGFVGRTVGKPYQYEGDLTAAEREDMGAFVKQCAAILPHDPRHTQEIRSQSPVSWRAVRLAGAGRFRLDHAGSGGGGRPVLRRDRIQRLPAARGRPLGFPERAGQAGDHRRVPLRIAGPRVVLPRLVGASSRRTGRGCTRITCAAWWTTRRLSAATFPSTATSRPLAGARRREHHPDL